MVRVAGNRVQVQCAREGLLGTSCLQPRAGYGIFNPEIWNSEIARRAGGLWWSECRECFGELVWVWMMIPVPWGLGV